MELFGKCIERGRRSMIKNIWDDSLCTACGACENSCNFQAIIRTKRKDDSWYMQIDDTKCKNCNRCFLLGSPARIGKAVLPRFKVSLSFIISPL